VQTVYNVCDERGLTQYAFTESMIGGVGDDGRIHTDDLVPREAFTGTLVSGNEVFMSARQFSGINGGTVIDAVFENNVVHGAASGPPCPTALQCGDGMHFSMWTDAMLPGTCSGDANRLCETDADCNLAPPEVPAACADTVSLGTCEGEKLVSNLALGANGVLLSGNHVDGGPTSGIVISRGTRRAVVVDNQVNVTGRQGVQVRFDAIESTTMLRNSVSGARMALLLYVPGSPFARFYGSHFSQNDFQGSPQGVVSRSCSLRPMLACTTDADCLDLPASGACTVTSLAFDAELSVDGIGNYWGHTCAEGGFLVSDASAMDGDDGVCAGGACSLDPSRACVADADCKQVRDSHPLGAPSALPPCR